MTDSRKTFSFNAMNCLIEHFPWLERHAIEFEDEAVVRRPLGHGLRMETWKKEDGLHVHTLWSGNGSISPDWLSFAERPPEQWKSLFIRMSNEGSDRERGVPATYVDFGVEDDGFRPDRPFIPKLTFGEGEDTRHPIELTTRYPGGVPEGYILVKLSEKELSYLQLPQEHNEGMRGTSMSEHLGFDQVMDSGQALELIHLIRSLGGCWDARETAGKDAVVLTNRFIDSWVKPSC